MQVEELRPTGLKWHGHTVDPLSDFGRFLLRAVYCYRDEDHGDDCECVRLFHFVELIAAMEGRSSWDAKRG